MKFTAIASTVLLTAASARAAEPAKHSNFVKDTFGKVAIIGAGVSAGVGQLRNSPKAWGQGAEGFGKRFASGFAGHIVNSSITYGVAHALHEDLHYYPSNKQGFGPRLGYALESTVITHKTDTGDKTVAVGRISGAVGSGFISRFWQPVALHTFASGITSAGVSLGAQAGTNVIREFWPEIRHPRSRE
jgi:hypothetical protein